MKRLVCPGCGSVNDGQSGLNTESNSPSPGAVTICAYCQTVAIVEDDGLTLRKATPGELPPDIDALLAEVAKFLKARDLKRAASN